MLRKVEKETWDKMDNVQENIIPEGQKANLEKAIGNSIALLQKSEEEREEKRKIMQMASISNPDLAMDYIIGLESKPLTLKQQAEILRNGASIYNSFAEDHPILAEYGTSAALLAAKTLIG